MTKCVKIQKKLIRRNIPGRLINKKKEKMTGYHPFKLSLLYIDNNNTIQFVIFINNEL